MDNDKKFNKHFLIFTIGQAFLLLGDFTVGSSFKVLPSWLSLFSIFIVVGYILFYIAFITFYKVNRNYLRSFVAFIVFLLVTIFADACSQSKSDFYLAWSRGLSTSAKFLLCVMYVYFFFGTRDYFHDLGHTKGKKACVIGAIVLTVLFIAERALTFVASLSAIKVHYIPFSICRFGSWGLIFAIDIYLFVIFLVAYIRLKKKPKEELKDEETA